jgi:hypothetical protein
MFVLFWTEKLAGSGGTGMPERALDNSPRDNTPIKRQGFRVTPKAFIDKEKKAYRAFWRATGLTDAEIDDMLIHRPWLEEREAILGCINYFFRKRPVGGYVEGRFNTSDHHCVYASILADTAAIEQVHSLMQTTGVVWPITLVSYDFNTTGIYFNIAACMDLSVKSWLTADDRTYTQKVGSLARHRAADGIVAESARHNGCNFAAFTNHSVVPGQILDEFKVDGRGCDPSQAETIYSKRTKVDS